MSDGLQPGQTDPEESLKTPTPSTVAETAATAYSPTLDDLLSPIEPTGKFPIRDSVAASDVTDENRFSTVALSSARQSFESARLSVHAEEDVEKEHDDRRDTVALDPIDVTTPFVKHAKSPSATTVLTAHNVPYMLSRLDQEGEEAAEGAASKRSSVASQKAAQEEFARRQQDRLDEEDAVDWGEPTVYLVISHSEDPCAFVQTSGATLCPVRTLPARPLRRLTRDKSLDYQKFAAEHPEELAAAIGKGIPKTIRGMMWQLM